MRKRKLGSTGIEVSEIGFGAWAIGGNAVGNSYGPTNDAVSVEAVRAALDLGCTFFDTADVYGHGHSEYILGSALGTRRRDVVVATKVGGDFYGATPRPNFGLGYIRTALEMSLKRLGTNYIDLYQLHNPPVDYLRHGELFELLEALKKEGKIRAAGVSIFDPSEGIVAIGAFTPPLRPGAIQVVYSLFSPYAADKLFPLAAEKRVGIVAREPLANGFLSAKYHDDSTFPEGDIRAGWPPEYVSARAQAARRLGEFAADCGIAPAQLALRWVISRPEVSVAIPGIKTPEQARENLAAAEMGPLDDEVLRGLRLVQKREFGL